jgi:hypothetical protein
MNPELFKHTISSIQASNRQKFGVTALGDFLSKDQMSNVEQGIPNDEVERIHRSTSAFTIHYSTCPLCPQTDFIQIHRTCGR